MYPGMGRCTDNGKWIFIEHPNNSMSASAPSNQVDEDEDVSDSWHQSYDVEERASLHVLSLMCRLDRGAPDGKPCE